MLRAKAVQGCGVAVYKGKNTLFCKVLCKVFGDIGRVLLTNVLQAKRKLTGIMNFTNPGAISHNEVSWACTAAFSSRGCTTSSAVLLACR
jgi:hypothetical protein